MNKIEVIKLVATASLSIALPFLNPLFGANKNEENLSECILEYNKQQNDNAILFPRSSGPFAIGYKNIELTDMSRSDPYNTEKNRRLKLTFYYPATGSSHHFEPYGEEEFVFWHRELAAIPSLKESLGTIMEQIRALSINKSLDVEPLPGKYPVLLFNHGFGVTAGSYQSLFQELVSHGYIVCAIHNPYVADTVIFQNEDQLFRKAVRDSVAVDTCFDDATFVLSSLPKIEYFANSMDLNNIGTLGHSLGGITAMRMARTCDQIKAAIQLDAPIQDLFDYVDGSIGFNKPFLHLFADETSFLKTPLNIDNFKAFITGAEHNSFADHEILEKILPFFKEEGEPDLTRYRTIISLIRLFFDQFIKNDHSINIESFNNQFVILEVSRK